MALKQSAIILVSTKGQNRDISNFVIKFVEIRFMIVLWKNLAQISLKILSNFVTVIAIVLSKKSKRWEQKAGTNFGLLPSWR